MLKPTRFSSEFWRERSFRSISLQGPELVDRPEFEFALSRGQSVQKHFFVLLGTRPEAIKLFPVISRLKVEKQATVTVCATAQHRQLLDQVLKLVNIVPDIDLNVMAPNQ